MEQKTVASGGRFWEIDALRGMAIIMMVIFHLLYDLDYFGFVPVAVHSGFWRSFALVTASLFVFLVGVSLSISHARAQQRLDGFPLYLKYFRRGAGIFLLGVLISAVTYLFLGDGYVVFGILHLIGLSIIIAPLFFPYPRGCLIGGILVIAAGFFITGIEGPIWLAWLGVHPAGFYSIDYEPLFPWFGLVLLGLFTGGALYPGGKRRFLFADIRNPFSDGLSYLGRHSLLIYVLHQPVILILLFAIMSFWMVS
jgi:uncharacterized membrane protein